MTTATWNATGLFAVTASDSVICKVAPGAEEFAALLASAPDLLAERDRLSGMNSVLMDLCIALRAERDRLQAANADLAEALQSFMSGAVAMGWNTRKARAALEKHQKETS